MRLTKLVLEDVGVYGGRHELEFPTSPEKPVVLYGGTNGSGKSTLFESIPLCLYGQAAGRAAKKQYHQKIMRLFHRGRGGSAPSPESAVSLEFEYAAGGRIAKYTVARRWQNNSGKIDEFLSLYRDEGGKPVKVDAASPAQAQAAINRMIPPAVADMFFFDGERIKNIVRDGDEHLYIKSSFDGLLGLNVSEQLRDDVDLYMIRNSGGDEGAALAELERLGAEKDSAERKMEEMNQKRAFLEGEISAKNRALQESEERFFGMGGDRAADRKRMVEEKRRLEKRLGELGEQARRLAEDLPLLLVRDRLGAVAELIQADRSTIRDKMAKEAVESSLLRVAEKFRERMPAEQEMQDELGRIVDAEIKSRPDAKGTAFDFSLSEMDRLMQRIGGVLEADTGDLAPARDAYRGCAEKLAEVSARLDAAPQQDEVGRVYSAIKDAAREIGEMEQELHTLELLSSQEKSRLVLLNGRMRDCLKAKRAGQRDRLGLDLAPRIRDALEEYSARLRAAKIAVLEANIMEGIRRCFHKSRLITRVSVDPQTYRVSLFDGDSAIPREALSNGELQLYVTAIVWGLAKTSGRPLPFVVDTPLARLDVEHRENMIQNFYPEASHQTIMFSTDTEVVDSYYDMMRPYLSGTMLIRHDAGENRSVVGDGYFGGGAGE